MLDLALAVAATTGIAVVLRLARQFGHDLRVVIAANYAVAAILAAALRSVSTGPSSVESITLVLAIGGGFPVSYTHLTLPTTPYV